MKDNPIGVFDSGIGGLYVLDRLIEALPGEDFIYVADSKNFPYGTRPPAEIAGIVTAVTRYILKQNVKALVIACNTATAHSGHLRAVVDIPIIGVIEPTARVALAAGSDAVIAVLATNATVKSGIYQKYINELAPGATVIPVGCSEFASAIESGDIGTASSYRRVAAKLSPYAGRGIAAVILGCTHFDLYRREIAAALPGARLISAADPTAGRLEGVLREKELLKDAARPGTVTIMTTGDAETLKQQIAWFRREYRGVYQIDL